MAWKCIIMRETQPTGSGSGCLDPEEAVQKVVVEPCVRGWVGGSGSDQPALDAMRCEGRV